MYNSEWYNLGPSEAKSVLIFTSRCIIPQQITGGKFTTLSLPLFANVRIDKWKLRYEELWNWRKCYLADCQNFGKLSFRIAGHEGVGTYVIYIPKDGLHICDVIGYYRIVFVFISVEIHDLTVYLLLSNSSEFRSLPTVNCASRANNSAFLIWGAHTIVS